MEINSNQDLKALLVGNKAILAKMECKGEVVEIHSENPDLLEIYYDENHGKIGLYQYDLKHGTFDVEPDGVIILNLQGQYVPCISLEIFQRVIVTQS